MTVLLAAVLGVITCAANSGALAAAFVAGDRQFILHNALVGDLDAALRAFVTDYWSILGGESFAYYRPLTVLTHWMDAGLWGMNPFGHHLTNVLIHSAVTVLVFAFCRRLLPGCRLVPFTAALLFGVHPIHTHSVTYVMGRTDMLAALFFIASLLSLCRPRCTAGRLCVGSACFLAALLCKEIAVTLPLVYGLYCTVLQRGGRRPADCRRVFAALGLVLALYGAARIFAVGFGGAAAGGDMSYALWQRVLLVFTTLGFYCLKLLLPLNLCYYSNLVVPHAQMSAADVLCTAAGLLFPVFCMTIRRYRPALFACLWIAVTLLPVLNLITLPVLAKENYLYLPSIGFCLLAALVIGALQKRGARLTAAACIGCIVLLYATQLSLRNRDYRDPADYLRSAVRTMRPVPPGRIGDRNYFEAVKNWFTTCRNLGRLAHERKDAVRAEYWFLRALDYTPGYFDPRYAADCRLALGRLYLEQDRPREAQARLREALAGSDRPHIVSNLLGVSAGMLHDFDAAERFFKKAVQLQPQYAPAYNNLARLYNRQGRLQEAQEVIKGLSRCRSRNR